MIALASMAEQSEELDLISQPVSVVYNTFESHTTTGSLFTEQTYCLSQTSGCDIVQLDYLQFIYNQDIDINLFIEMMNKSVFTVTIGGTIISQIRIDLMCHIEPCKKHNNSIFIKIPNYLLQNINIIYLQFQSIIYTIHYKSSILPNRVNLLNSNIYLSTNERIDMSIRPYDQSIQQIQTIDINLHDAMLSIEQICEFSRITKGYLIQGNIDKLVSFKLLISGHDRIVFDKDLIDLYCFKISDKLLYVSLDNINHLKDSRSESFRGGFNQSRVVTMIKMAFSEPQYTYVIHSVTCNKLKYAHGMVWSERSEVNIGFSDPIYRIVSSTIQMTWVCVNKLINLEKNDTCPISSNMFMAGDKFCCCHQCKTNFGEEPLKVWLNSRRTCPICRTTWNDYTIYKNIRDDVVI